MLNFFVAASGSFKPFFFSFQNPFSALLKSQSRFALDRANKTRLETASGLQRMARDLEHSQPSLAAELRYFASKS